MILVKYEKNERGGYSITHYAIFDKAALEVSLDGTTYVCPPWQTVTWFIRQKQRALAKGYVPLEIKESPPRQEDY